MTDLNLLERSVLQDILKGAECPPLIWAEYDCGEHSHMAVAHKDEGAEVLGEYLADAVLRCDPSRHGGHGRKHTNDQVQAAYKAAVSQALTRDYCREWQELRYKIWLHHQWGNTGPVPAAVLQPDEHDPRQWNLLKVNERGGVTVHKVKPSFAREMPTPQQVGAYKTELGYHIAKPRRLRRHPK